MAGTYNADIHVVLDPVFGQLAQAVPINNEAGMSQDSESIAGKKIPVVLINRKMIMPSNVKRVFIDFRDSYPSGWVEVFDPDNMIYRNDVPGANNRILVTVVPETSLSYRKIKIPGYITDAYQNGSTIRYEFQFKYMPLEKAYVKSWPRTNTFNFFRNIAEDTGLGLAVGENVESVEDIRYRCCTGMPLKDFLSQQISFAGIDDESVMDFWVDPWGYINIVNIDHQISKIQSDAKMSMTAGRNAELGDLDAPRVDDYEVPRMITNLDMGDKTNINIESFKPVTDNSAVLFQGNCVTRYTMTAEGVNG